MNEDLKKQLERKIEGSMLLSILNRTKVLDVISNSTYTEIKKNILHEYKISLK